jgi:hypothetical protein
MSDSENEPEGNRTRVDIDGENQRKNVYYEIPADYEHFVKPKGGVWPIDEVGVMQIHFNLFSFQRMQNLLSGETKDGVIFSGNEFILVKVATFCFNHECTSFRIRIGLMKKLSRCVMKRSSRIRLCIQSGKYLFSGQIYILVFRDLNKEHVALLSSIEKKSTKAIIDTKVDIVPKDLIFYVSYHPKVSLWRLSMQ